ncbi:Stk1 family PASTA domain-containing Ser/Thr kinase [Corynebacterium sp. 3HC-13]|uniref:Stk1 family PASTA domain-containing Ser/Thr kinase n=1 Tax=Corynebacterium poyangense TaxID=2684405 RepID=UPI001CCB0CE2|nr:Stk1 family PASTA domain-containing Ser/Thr kinase [Corynebacterium poyangense]MBZ8177303.1 Stk1 family PASTA domain-containing Ser/Thr kinase [Corynebacterium poyangense]
MNRLIADRYALGEIIGSGGMSEVFAAEDTLIGRDVALKMLRTELARDINFRERFRREAQNSGRLNHSSIVAVYDTGETDVDGVMVPYIVMERVHGRTLRDMVRQDGPLSPTDAAHLLQPVCDALQHSHDAGIIHRDIKPANIMITNTGAVKVMDFGIARALDDSTSAMTQTSAIIGTAQYLSPEQARGKSADARSDLYALGCVLYEAVTGQPPFAGETPFAVAYQHVQEDPPPPSQEIHGLSRNDALNIDAVVLTAMAKNPADRYQSAKEMADDLNRLSRSAVTRAAGAHIHDTPTALTERIETPEPDPAAPTTTMTAAEVAPGNGRHRAPESDNKNARRAAKESSGTPRWLGILAGVLTVIALVVGSAFAWDYFDLGYRLGLSNSRELVQIPDVTGKPQAEATTTLENAGFKVDVNQEPNPDVAEGTVIRTNPGVGSELQRGTSVTLVVSSGREITEVPDLRGKTTEEAAGLLAKAELQLDSSVREEPDDKTPQGQVSQQDPAAGSKISKGSRVRITVSSGPERVRVPDISGMSWDKARGILEDLGLHPQPNYVDSREAEGTVVSSAASGQELRRGDTITVDVSNGMLIAMPDIGRMTQAQAVQALRNAGWQGSASQLRAGDIVRTPAITDEGKIADFSPQAGADVRKDATINVRYWKFDLSALSPGR